MRALSRFARRSRLSVGDIRAGRPAIGRSDALAAQPGATAARALRPVHDLAGPTIQTTAADAGPSAAHRPMPARSLSRGRRCHAVSKRSLFDTAVLGLILAEVCAGFGVAEVVSQSSYQYLRHHPSCATQRGRGGRRRRPRRRHPRRPATVVLPIFCRSAGAVSPTRRPGPDWRLGGGRRDWCRFSAGLAQVWGDATRSPPPPTSRRRGCTGLLPHGRPAAEPLPSPCRTLAVTRRRPRWGRRIAPGEAGRLARVDDAAVVGRKPGRPRPPPRSPRCPRGHG